VWRDLAGTDDRITRGNGDLRVGWGAGVWVGWQSADSGKLRLSISGDVRRENLGGHSWQLEAAPMFVPSDSLTVAVSVIAERRNGWVIWTGGSELGSYASKQLTTSLEANWFPALRHELRAKFQWLGLDAAGRTAYTVAGGPDPVPLPEPAEDFSLSQLGLQIRYRYELAPLSDLFVVYERGGAFFEESLSHGMHYLWSEAVDGTTADRFLFKLRYRF